MQSFECLDHYDEPIKKHVEFMLDYISDLEMTDTPEEKIKVTKEYGEMLKGWVEGKKETR